MVQVSKFSSAAKKHLRAFDQEGRDAISDFRAEGKNVLEWFKKKVSATCHLTG